MGTTNKNLELPAYNSTNWNTPLNSNFQIIDNTFGNSKTVNVGAADQILGYADLQSMRLYITGNIAANNRVVTIPATVGGSWIVTNAVTYTTGTVTLKSAAGGSGLVLTPGGSAVVYSDGTEVYSATSGATGSYLPLTGGTLSGPLTLQSTLGVSGITTFASNVNFNGGMTLPLGQTFTVNGSLGFSPTASFSLGSIALGGATISSNALAVKGSSSFDGNLIMSGGNIQINNGSISVPYANAANNFAGTTTFNGSVNVNGQLSALSFNPTNITLTGQLNVQGAGANNISGTTTIPTGSKLVFQANSTLDMSASPTTLSLGSNAVTTTGAVNGATVTATGTVTGATVTSTGALNGTSLNIGSGAITAGAITGSSLNVSSGAITGGTLTGSSLNLSSGAITCGNITASGTVALKSTTGIWATTPTLNMANSSGSTVGQFYTVVGTGTGFSYTGGASGYVGTASNSGFRCTGPYTDTTSDGRLKTNIVTLSDSLAKVKALRGVSFVYKNDLNLKRIGFIAQEAREVIPEIVVGSNEVLIEGEEGRLGVQYANVVALLVEAIKELEARVAELEAK